MNTLNLSVDNALTSQQIIHQLITKLNELVEYVNNMQLDALDDANKYTDKKFSELNRKITNLNADLNRLELSIENAKNDAITKSKEYTDINVEELNKKIEDVLERVADILKESKLYTDDKIKIVNREIELLDNRLETLAKNSFASVSMLDGSIKKNTDCFYDMLHVFQRKNSITLDNIIAMLLYVSDTNAPPDGILASSNMDTMLHYAKDGALTIWYKPLRNMLITTSYSGYTEYQMVPPTWGNIVSCGMYALMGLGKPGYVGSNPEPYIRPLGAGTVMYNCYYNKSDTDGYTQFVKVTGTEFKPFDITKM